MERHTPQMKITLAIIGAISIAVVLFIFGCFETHGATPTASPPFDVNAVDVSIISEADIQATIAHRNALHEMLIQQTLPAASQDVKEAVDKAQNLQKEIDALALSAAKVPVLEADLAKAHKACWRNLFIGGVIGAVLVLVGPKLLGLASMVGV
jgi:hypothetical protein